VISARSGHRPAGRPDGWAARLGWQGVAIVVCMALINALRRTVFNIADDPDFGPVRFVEATATGLLVGFAMLIAVAATLNRYPQRGHSQYLAVAAATAASSAISVFVKDLWEMAGPVGATSYPEHWDLARYFVSDWLRYLVTGALVAGAYLYLRAQAEDAAITHQCAAESARMARQLAEARLRVLEAQIEPHFLFNSIATVKRLFQTNARAGERMLDNLMRYLSVALPQLRSAESTLRREAALATAYLDLHTVRMGRRMTFTMSVPRSLDDARVPAFMLLTLIENAIKHGLNPLPEGGALHVTARSMDRKLIVEVRDTGRGFERSWGGGTGLANIRARLALLYGAEGSLQLSHNHPRGVVATLVVPLLVVPLDAAHRPT
jgi:signal transduction histidine kinase